MRKIIILGIGLLTYLVTAVSGVEAKSYSIESVSFDGKINLDGSMDVVESRTYDFDGDYTFAYRTIEKIGQRAEQYEIDEVSVCESDTCYQQLDPRFYTDYDNSRPDKTFYVTDQHGVVYIKWFFRANGRRTFVTSYRVKNAVTLQQDTAELYWKIIGSDWEIDQKSISATFELPSGVSGNQVQAWAHGPLSGKVSIPDEHTVLYNLGNISKRI